MVATLGKLCSRGARFAGGFMLVLLCVLVAGTFSDAAAQKVPVKRTRSPFNLSAGAQAMLAANLVRCNVNNIGEVCVDPTNSPTAPGGWWPAGTTNQYIFNSGLQLAGIVGQDGGPWAGDTTGAFFFDARGDQNVGTPLTDLYRSLEPQDLLNWPEGGIVDDPDIFNEALLGSKAISDLDSYVEYWEGDPSVAAGSRLHPLGIKVQQRTMSFNAPAGAENTIFVVYKFTNVTNDPTFQQLNEQRFGVSLPDAGWTIDQMYAGFGMDPDVTTHAGDNFSTAILPLNMSAAYHGLFETDDFDFAARADLYAPPFFQGPGFVGVKYLRSPVDPVTGLQVGLTMFTNTTNGAPFPDPVGVKQLFRFMKGVPSAAAGDPVCTIPNSVQARLCALVQSRADTRFMQASGPFSLAAGEAQTIVVGYTHGAPVRVAGYTPGDEVRPGIPSRTPGTGTDTLRLVERIAGFITTVGAQVGEGEDRRIDETLLAPGVHFVPRSLVSNALVAQSIFNNKFLLPRPPEPPPFSLVPGDQQVTVVWAPSASEESGDPYFTIASNETSPLFNPNYRQFDVEGYRIYRGTGLSGDFELIAQFDHKGTLISDVTCELDPQFVPEEEDAECEGQDIELVGDITMFAEGGRIRNAVTGSVQVLPNGSQTITLQDTGVPFAFVDRGVRNGITYRYMVTAFDVNSLKSGALSLESARQIQLTTPRKDPNNMVFASFSSSVSNAAGEPLPAIPFPTINSGTGIFSGPMPPTNGLSATFSPLVERLLPAFNLKAVVDSIIPYTFTSHPSGCPNGSNALGGCWRIYMTFERDGVKTSSISEGWSPHSNIFGDPLNTEFAMGSGTVPPDVTAAGQFGLPETFPGFVANVVGTFPMTIMYSQSEGHFNRRAVDSNWQIYPGFATGERFVPGGSRWFSGTNETEPDPTRLIRVGHIDGVDSIWAPIHHTATLPGAANANRYPASTQMQCFSYWVPQVGRAADVKFTWGANGAVTVTDVSHNTPVIFKPTAQASYGFLNTDANGNGVIDWADFNHIENVSPAYGAIDGVGTSGGFCGHDDNPAQRVQLEATAELNPVSTAGTTITTAKPATGQGFGLYINGERYIFQTSALPASGQNWTLRTYSGLLRCPTAAISLDPGGCTFWANFEEDAIPEPRQPMVTGVQFSAASTSASGPQGEVDITQVHTVPDPYYVRSAFELGPSNKALRFVNLPTQAIIRIYTLNGTLVRVLEHNSEVSCADRRDCQGAEMQWDLRNRNNQFVASGVYFYVVEGEGGKKHTGKMTIVQFAR